MFWLYSSVRISLRPLAFVLLLLLLILLLLLPLLLLLLHGFYGLHGIIIVKLIPYGCVKYAYSSICLFSFSGQGGAAGTGALPVYRPRVENRLRRGQGLRARPPEKAAGFPVDGEGGVGPLRRHLGAHFFGEIWAAAAAATATGRGKGRGAGRGLT